MEYIPARTIVTKTKYSERWFGYDYNMNIYKGCNHGCIYCDSRSDCYRVENFDSVRAKEDALKIIRDDLRRKTKTGIIGTGAMSDPYNPYEKKLKLTRNSLELVNAYGFGVGIATKSDLIVRDIDILKDIKEHSPVLAKITITTADDGLAKIIEPAAPSPSQRFAALKELSSAGIYCGILLMPVLPFIEDHENNILSIVEQGAKAGVDFIYPSMGVTLRSNQRVWYYNKLDKHFPGLKEKYMNHYDNKYYCNSPNTRKLMKVFREACKKHDIIYEMPKIIKRSKNDYTFTQMSLF